MSRQRSKTVTLSDVARLASVSVATASKALNDRAQVAPQTRQRVLRAAQELSFQPNQLARGLISGRTRTIGLITDELAHRFSIPILLAVENALGSEQMSVLLCDSRGDAIRRKHYIRALLSRGVDGLIMLGASNDQRTSISAECDVPVVYVYGESDGPGDLSVLSDDRGGARLATEHLVGLGHTRIAHITGPEHYRAARDRVASMREVLDAAGLALAGGSVHYGEWSQRWGRNAAHQVLGSNPEVQAIFCGNDQIAAGVLGTARELGRRVPDDLSLVGYDNWLEFSADAAPPLTTVDLQLQRLGEHAVKSLFEALEGRPESGVVRQPCRLIVRDSTGPVPSRNGG